MSSPKIKVFASEQVVTAHDYYGRECWVPGKDTKVIVHRTTVGNLLPADVYEMTFSEAVKGGYLSTDAGTMDFNLKSESGNSLYWIKGVNTYGYLLPENQ